MTFPHRIPASPPRYINDGTITFTAASKTLSVEDDAVVSQDMSSDGTPTLGGLTLTGDISGVGGFKQSFCFMQSDVAANQTAVAFDVLGLAGNTEVVMPYAGSIIGISVASNEARSAGTP